MDTILQFAASASPLAIITLLVLVIYQLITAQKTHQGVSSLADNHFHSVEEQLTAIDAGIRSLHESLGRIERDLAVVRSIVEAERRA